MMKTLFFHLKLFCSLFIMLPFFYGCNNEEYTDANRRPSYNLGIKIAIINNEGKEVIADIPTVMPGFSNYWHDDSSKGLNPQAYTLDFYMDEQFVCSLTQPKEQVDWPIVKEANKNGCPWWSIVLPIYHAYKIMSDKGTYNNIHTIEYHMKYEDLFGDTDVHIIKFVYKTFVADALTSGFYADVYFDGKKMETYYPEIFKFSAASKGFTPDIDDKYWMEGAVGWPIAIITLNE